MEQCRNTKAGETRDPRKNLPASGIIKHNSHMRKSKGNPIGSQTQFTLVGGDKCFLQPCKVVNTTKKNIENRCTMENYLELEKGSISNMPLAERDILAFICALTTNSESNNVTSHLVCTFQGHKAKQLRGKGECCGKDGCRSSGVSWKLIGCRRWNDTPDLNPIEHLWDKLDCRVRAHQMRPKSIAQLMEWLQEEWQRIPVDVLQTLVESMLDRVDAVLAARGTSGASQCNNVPTGLYGYEEVERRKGMQVYTGIRTRSLTFDRTRRRNILEVEIQQGFRKVGSDHEWMLALPTAAPIPAIILSRLPSTYARSVMNYFASGHFSKGGAMPDLLSRRSWSPPQAWAVNQTVDIEITFRRNDIVPTLHNVNHSTPRPISPINRMWSGVQMLRALAPRWREVLTGTCCNHLGHRLLSKVKRWSFTHRQHKRTQLQNCGRGADATLIWLQEAEENKKREPLTTQGHDNSG
ncbi:hypothetical protein PR048_028803 [Dryococelus australis]|uniref:Transposase n=1 Tax=Dryococelus australis TaxID=614101 RepID=A0ABQ9GBK5_9NEOP|nr:hypothetical protein PR048_028803 [Dryococelus australis]